MDANAPRRARLGRPVVAAAVVALVAVVAIASSGAVPDGGVAQRRPSEGLIDTVVSLVLVLMVVASVATVVLLSFFRRYTADMRVRTRPSPRRTAVMVLLVVIAVALTLNAVARREDGLSGFLGRTPPEGSGGSATASPDRYEPEFAIWPVVGVVALALVALGAWWLSARGRRAAREPLRQAPAEALADVLSETLDDLRRERDPRRAVIGAYARMERSLAAAGLPRTAAEAPEEYLERVLAAAAVSKRAAGRLTALFERARFSEHAIDHATKDDAISALEQIQDELAADEAEGEARLAGALG